MQSEMGGIVMDAVAMAMQDLDWEMKLGALKFWELILQTYIPDFSVNDATVDAAVIGATPNCKRKPKQIVLNCTLEVFLLKTGCLRMLMQGSRDEDPSVHSRTCLMLHQLQSVMENVAPQSGGRSQQAASELESGLSEENSSNEESCCIVTKMQDANEVHSAPPTTPYKGGTQSDASSLEEIDDSSCPLIGQLLHTDWTARLKHGEADNVDGPVSLMMDIIAAAEEKEENLLDCY